MKTAKKNIPTDYGIYIDHSHCILIVLKGAISTVNVMKHNLVSRPRFDGEVSDKTGMFGVTINREKKHQERLNEDFRKFCSTVIQAIVDPNRIIVFGPSDAKHEFQKELIREKRLHRVYHGIETTNKMSRNKALDFTTKYFEKAVTSKQTIE